jgi:hypothetical protein
MMGLLPLPVKTINSLRLSVAVENFSVLPSLLVLGVAIWLLRRVDRGARLA